MNEPRHAWKPKKVLKNSLSVFNEGVWSSKIPEVISNLRNMHTYSWRDSKCTFSKGGISMWLSSAYKKIGPRWSFEMNQLLCIMDSTHIKGAKNTQAFLKSVFPERNTVADIKLFPGLPWALLEIRCMDNTHSNLWLSLGDIHPASPWQAGFPVQPHRIYCLIVVEKNWA